MKILKIIIALSLFLACTSVYAYETKEIIEEISTNNIKGLLLKKENYHGVADKAGIVRTEVVFVKDGVRYTVWDLDKYDGDDVLRVFFRENGKLWYFNINTTTGEIIDLISPDGRSNYYSKYQQSEFSPMPKDEAEKIVTRHVMNIHLFLGLQ